MSLFEIIPLVVSILTGLGSLGLAILVFRGRRRGVRGVQKRQLRADRVQAERYKARLESWRARGYLVIDDETWDRLMTTGKTHPETYARVYKAIHPHVRQIKAIKDRKSYYAKDNSIRLSTPTENKDARSKDPSNEPGFLVEAPVPL